MTTSSHSLEEGLQTKTSFRTQHEFMGTYRFILHSAVPYFLIVRPFPGSTHITPIDIHGSLVSMWPLVKGKIYVCCWMLLAPGYQPIQYKHRHSSSVGQFLVFREFQTFEKVKIQLEKREIVILKKAQNTQRISYSEAQYNAEKF